MTEGIKTHLSYLAVILLLSVSLGLSLGRKNESEVKTVTIHERDTIVEVIHDTTTITNYIVSERHTTDTTYICYNDTVYVPVPIETLVIENDLFKAQISGFNPKLDWIDLYQTNKTVTVNETTMQTVVKHQWEAYFGAVLRTFDRDMVIGIGATIKSPKNWLFGLDLSLYNNRPMYGASVQYKITHNK